jgi:hypothetical protein
MGCKRGLAAALCWAMLPFSGPVFSAPRTARPPATPAPLQANGLTRIYTDRDIKDYFDRLDGIGDAVHSAGAISDLLCFALIVNPEGFLLAAEQRRALFAVWLDNLQDWSFTEHGGCINRSCLRDRMLQVLGDPSITPLGASAASVALAGRVRARLLEITVRVDLH